MITQDEMRRVADDLWGQIDEYAEPLYVDAIASYTIASLGYPRDAWWALTHNIRAQIDRGAGVKAGQVMRLRHAVSAFYAETMDE